MAVILVSISSMGAWAIAGAQEVDAAQSKVSKTEPERDAITGTVLNSVTGEPINRAVVQLGGLNRATMTDASGHFEFHNLQGLRVSVTVDKPGFFDERDQAEVLADTAVSELLLRMVPAGAIRGKITTQVGEPIEGVRVKAFQRQISAGRQVWVDRMVQSLTDENGAFRIAGLPPSIYFIATEQSREPIWMPSAVPSARRQVYAQSFYPGVTQLSMASPINLGGGQEVEADFSLTAEMTYKVAGALSTPDEISSGVVFERLAGQDIDFFENVVAHDGRFEIELPAGSYAVEAYTSQNARVSTSGSFVISSDMSDVGILLSSGISIPVIVRTSSDGNSLQEVDDSTAHSMVEVKLHGASNAPSLHNHEAWWAGPHAHEIPYVEGGRYEVELNTFGQWRIESAKCGGVDLLNGDLVVTPGSTPGAIEIALRDDGATVIGRVARDPWSSTTVFLVQQRRDRNFVKIVRTTLGNFRFSGLAPGEYSLIASDELINLEYMNPEVLDSYLATADHITLQSRATANVRLNVSRTSR
ncbi:MAG TPA: carboxypeptidase-like regulatory domain-containing protein [Terriglobales bacterium]|nr:carboxypeptidase-like regulatory domain-containing protein [Terriglobales bacterium]